MFVLELAANAEMNITTWFHLNAGVSYRVTGGVNQVGLSDRDFSNVAATLTFKFGSF
jgi:hypothetical protein